MGRPGLSAARALRGLVAVGTVASLADTAHVAVNLRLLRVPDTAEAPDVTERVSVLLPVRDEAGLVQRCLRSMLAWRGLADLEVLVLDDGSADRTSDLVRVLAGQDPRLRLTASCSTWGLPC